MVTKKIKHKGQDGNVIEVDIGAEARNITEDAAHRFATDTERTAWNGKVAAAGGDVSNTKVTTMDSVTTAFPVPVAGDTMKAFAGKVRKSLQDWNDFKAGIITLGKLVNNGTTTGAGFALDARYGKTLNDAITQLNGDLSSKISPEGIGTNQVGFKLRTGTAQDIIVNYGRTSTSYISPNTLGATVVFKIPYPDAGAYMLIPSISWSIRAGVTVYTGARTQNTAAIMSHADTYTADSRETMDYIAVGYAPSQ